MDFKSFKGGRICLQDRVSRQSKIHPVFSATLLKKVVGPTQGPQPFAIYVD